MTFGAASNVTRQPQYSTRTGLKDLASSFMAPPTNRVASMLFSIRSTAYSLLNQKGCSCLLYLLKNKGDRAWRSKATSCEVRSLDSDVRSWTSDPRCSLQCCNGVWGCQVAGECWGNFVECGARLELIIVVIMSATVLYTHSGQRDPNLGGSKLSFGRDLLRIRSLTS